MNKASSAFKILFLPVLLVTDPEPGLAGTAGITFLARNGWGSLGIGKSFAECRLRRGARAARRARAHRRDDLPLVRAPPARAPHLRRRARRRGVADQPARGRPLPAVTP